MNKAPKTKTNKTKVVENQESDHECGYDPSLAPSIVITPRSNPVVESVKRKRMRRDSVFKLPVKKFHKVGFHIDEDDAFKTDAFTISSTCSSASSSSPPHSDNDSEQLPNDTAVKSKPLLRPPVYFDGARQQKLDYILPYDCYLYKAEMKTTMFVGKSYRKIKQNIFADIKPVSEDVEENEVCDCKPPDVGNGCGSDCLNRCMLIECDPKLCPCGEKCSNQSMQKSKWAPGLERFMTRNRGWGVRTMEKIKEGDFILEYIGEIVSRKLFAERMVNVYHNDAHHYCLSLGPNILIDGYRAANEGRFVNHSCDPNCAMQKWSVGGLYRMGLFAKRDIEPGEELSYDYNFDSYNNENQQVCKCGSKNCRGVMGGRSKGNDRRSVDPSGKLKKRGRKKRRPRTTAKVLANDDKNGAVDQPCVSELNGSEPAETKLDVAIQHAIPCAQQ